VDGDAMATVTEATRQLQADGYTGNWYADGSGRLVCGECGAEFDPGDVTVDEVLRFEGQSDPDDEMIVFAVRGPCGHRGIFSAAYGLYMSSEDAAVIAKLRRGTGGDTVNQ
jgi:hypothetical protein